MFGNPLLLGDDGYQISRSVRLRSSASAYFNRTPASAGNRRTWTWSGWVKRGASGDGTGSNQFFLFSADDGLGTQFDFYQNTIRFYLSGGTYLLQTTQVFRDYSAWFHVVVSVDTTQATSANRIKLYVNGVQITAFSTAVYPTQNLDSAINGTFPHHIGKNLATNYFDGYLTEINLVDGQALTPSSFGETDAVTGVWKPKKYAGTYGTNGFYLNFSDNSAATASAIGKDYSGNGNNWTPNNISVTAGATYDSMLDVPTPWADGGNGRGNYATLNPLDQVGGRALTTSNGNLNFTGTYGESKSSIQLPESGKYYFEYVWTAIASTPAQFIAGIAGYQSDGQKSTGGAWSAYGASWTTNDVIGAAVDMDAKTVTFYKNGVSQGSISSPSYSNRDILTTSNGSAATNSGYANFGQRPFAYTPPTGFKALNTQNLPEPLIKKGNAYMDASLYTGTGSALSVTNAGFQPDLVWIKGRSSAYNHGLFDSSRGVRNVLQSNSTAAEILEAAGTSMTSFDTSGFSLGTNGGSVSTNVSGQTFVGWQWKRGATQGFDIVTYTGTGVARTINHSLGVKPAMMIIKNRSGAYDWPTWHQNLPNPTTQHFWLNATNPAQVSGSFNSTQPTSSVFSVGTTSEANANGNNFVAYLFAEVAGFSKFGSYTGNGSADGPFVFCGFRPRFVLIKRTDTAGFDWCIEDSARDTFNQATNRLFPNLSVAEIASGGEVDFLSNGFKWRGANNNNVSGGTYIFAAFAENPFKNALAR